MPKNEFAALEDYLSDIGKLGEAAREAFKQQIDKEAEDFRQFIINELKSISSFNTAGLIENFTKTKIDTGDKYGYAFEFTGNVVQTGAAYAAIANYLNSGTYTKGRGQEKIRRIEPTYFLTRGVRRLKGLNERAYARFEILVKEITD